MKTVTLYRPIGPRERKLIEETRWLSPRGSQGSRFLSRYEPGYASQIARDWNVSRQRSSIVTRSKWIQEFIKRYPVKISWQRSAHRTPVPAEEAARVQIDALSSKIPQSSRSSIAGPHNCIPVCLLLRFPVPRVPFAYGLALLEPDRTLAVPRQTSSFAGAQLCGFTRTMFGRLLMRRLADLATSWAVRTEEYVSEQLLQVAPDLRTFLRSSLICSSSPRMSASVSTDGAGQESMSHAGPVEAGHKYFR